MNVSGVPVCVYTDLTVPLKPFKYLSAAKREDTLPPVFTYISQVVMRMVTGNVLKPWPRRS